MSRPKNHFAPTLIELVLLGFLAVCSISYVAYQFGYVAGIRTARCTLADFTGFQPEDLKC